jgi:predicted pyridoxine 5'-phosphate oxidase superfamily flavin-nucleotide-binding protein
MSNQFKLLSTDEIEALYAPPHPPVVKAVKDHLTDFHLQYIEKATFFCLATGTEEGLDCSPRGGEPGFVRVIDPKTVCFADWPGNNKIASLRNLTERDQVAMLFLFPGLDIFMRINGRAGVTVDEPLLEQLTEDNRRPKTAINADHAAAGISRQGPRGEPSRAHAVRSPLSSFSMKPASILRIRSRV